MYNGIIFCMKYLHVLKTMKTKLLTRYYPKKHSTLHHIFYFLTGAGPEFPNHVIDNVITMPYHYFHVKNKHFGNY